MAVYFVLIFAAIIVLLDRLKLILLFV